MSNLLITGFTGMNNLQDKRRLKGPVAWPNGSVASAECRKIVNCDITDTLSAVLRPGSTLALAGTPHSLWSAKDETQAYFVDGSFKRLFAGTPYTAVSLRSLLAPSLPMSYAEVNYLIACSNGVDLFLVQNGSISDFVFSSVTFKEQIMTGHMLAYYRRRLYVATGNVLYYTDADDIETLDERDDPFVFGSRISMVLPLINGMYVAADKVYWLACKGPDELTITADHDLCAVEGTGEVIDGGLVGMAGNVGVFTAKEGICMGGEDGEVTNLTRGTLGFTAGQRGAALIRQSEGLNQYISWV
jgi:hypothetical protein